jgi:short-subunit dehydrogenase
LSKLILITGASSGLGLSHAIYLTNKGYTVIGTSRNASALDRDELGNRYKRDNKQWKVKQRNEKWETKKKKSLIPSEIEEKLPTLLEKIHYITMDVTSDSSVEEAIKQVQAKAKKLGYDGIDVLINNVGLGFYGSIEELPMAAWEQSFQTNVLGMIRVIKAVVPDMRKRRAGQIINTSSLGGEISIPFQGHYSATKAAVKAFTTSLRMELEPFDIKVSTVLPGDINTSFNKNTVALTQEQNALESIDVQQLIDNLPSSADSPYYDRLKQAWKVIVKNLIESPPPLVVSKKIHKIIKSKHPKVNYKAGDFSQILFSFLIRRILPDGLTNKFVEKYYGL